MTDKEKMNSIESKFGFKIINLSNSVDTPTFKESYNKKWINYGENNLYPQYLLEVYHSRSNKHKAIISKKSKMIAGNGFVERPEASAEYRLFVDNVFGKHTLEEIASKLAYDLEIYGGYSLKVKWSRDRKRIAAIYYMPYQKVRHSSEDGKFWVSKDWKNYRRDDNKPFEMYELSNNEKEEHPVQILYYTEDQPGLEYYPIPTYSSTLTWIEADWEISNFHLNSIKNGFSAGFILNFATGVPTLEEMDMAYKEFERKYTGSFNAGKFILTFSEGKDQAPELSPIELSTSDERFIMLSDQIKEEIFIGHEIISPMLFGVRTDGQLGGRDEIMESMELLQTTYIDYKQRTIENTLNKLGKINGIQEEIKLKQYRLFPEDTEKINEEDAES